jgi:hypothetical protein
VLLAVRRVSTLQQPLVIGLEKLIWPNEPHELVNS